MPITFILPHREASDLFPTTESPSEVTTIRVPTSIAVYEALWQDRLYEVFPTATVSFSSHQSEPIAYDEHGYASADLAAHAREIGTILYESGVWIIRTATYREEDPHA